MILRHTDILSFQFWSGSPQETEGQLSWNFENNVVKGLFMKVRAGLRETRGAYGLAADRGKLVPPLDLKCHKGSKPEPVESWSMEDGLPDRNCSCRGTQPLLEMWRWSRETWHSGDSACSLSLCSESLAGPSNWLDPVGSHQGI